MGNRFNFPHLGFGLGLRTPHYEQVLRDLPKVDWFEIISENFIEAHPGYWQFLADLRAHYPLAMHGVSLSIGSTDPLNVHYLKKLKQLADFIQPAWVSDHLCWTGMGHLNTHDLLPLPYTQETLAHVASRIRQVQEVLERPLVLENPSSYLQFNDSSMSEHAFLAALLEEADCALLLDVNNVYVSARNHGFEARDYIRAMPKDRVVQIHLAGHRDFGTHIIDTHDGPVIDPVLELYRFTLAQLGPVSTMVEWDENIPPFDTLLAELEKVRGAST